MFFTTKPSMGRERIKSALSSIVEEVIWGFAQGHILPAIRSSLKRDTHWKSAIPAPLNFLKGLPKARHWEFIVPQVESARRRQKWRCPLRLAMFILMEDVFSTQTRWIRRSVFWGAISIYRKLHRQF